MFLLATFGLFLVVGGIYFFYPSSTLNNKLLAIKAQHGCESPNHVSTPFFSIPQMLRFLKALNEHRGLSYIQAQFAKNGHTFTQWQLGRLYIWTDDPENIKEVLSVQYSNFNLGTFRRDAVAPLIGNGIFVSEGARWSHLRSVIRPSFSRAQVADLTMFEDHFQDLVERIPKDGTIVDLQDLFLDYALDITTDFLFGYPINSLRLDSDQTYKDFNSAFNYGLSRVWPRTRMGNFMNLVPDPEFRKSCAIVRDLTEKLVSQALSTRAPPDSEKASGRYIYLHELAASTSDPTELRDHALSILLAAKDSTSAGLSSTFYLLARHPSVWNKLSIEIGELNGEIPTYDRLKKLKYLYQVINEAMRFYPPIPINVRRATADTYLPRGGGPSATKPMLVRKGDTFLYSVYAMHRREDLWGEDADQFKPERWEGRQPGPEFLPFNTGPRICIGQNFAMTEIAYTVTRMVQTFESIESRDRTEWKERLLVALSSQNGVKVGLLGREKY